MSLFRDTTAGGAFADRIRKAGEHRPASASETRALPRQETRPERRPVFVNATLVLASGKMPAVVTNVNALGARVEFTANVTLQGSLVLVAPTIGVNSRVRIAWQRGGSAGLIFMKQEPVSA
jgi:hypothetical protein